MSAQIAPLERPAPRHVIVSGPRLTFTYQRCEGGECFVTPAGVGSACGEPACPSCGSGGTNLTSVGTRRHPAETELCCICGCAFVGGLSRPFNLGLASPAAAVR